MARVNATEYADKWQRRLTGAQQDIQKGINRVTESPGIKAANAQQTMLTNLLAAINDGTWAAQLRKMTLEDWKNSAINKGLQRIASGVAAAGPAQVQMAEKLLAAVDASLAVVNQTKRGDLEANISRMVTMAREMNKRKLRRPGA